MQQRTAEVEGSTSRLWLLLQNETRGKVCHSYGFTPFFYFTGNSQEDGVTLVLHKQPAGGVYQSFVCELFQPCAVPCSQLASPGALGWLLHPLEPPHETSGMLKSLEIVYTPCMLRISRKILLLLLPWPGTCSSALQGAAGEACRAAEESGRAAAGGDQSLGLLFLGAGGLPHALHHSGADLRLTQINLASRSTCASDCLFRGGVGETRRVKELPPKV